MRFILLLLPFVSGCSLFYSNIYSHKDFTIYSNRDQEEVNNIGKMAERLFEIYEDLLEVCLDDHLTIYLQGDSNNVVEADADDLLGYYISILWFDYISLDTAYSHLNKEDGEIDYDEMRVALAHEVSHYFILAKWPEIANKPWISEGLATVFETLLFDDERSELAYLNLDYYYVAASTIAKENVNLVRLVNIPRQEFYNSERKSAYYSLSWALCTYLLCAELSPGLSFSEKIEMMMQMESDYFSLIEREWTRFFLLLDVKGTLENLANDPDRKLVAEWAKKELEKYKAEASVKR